MNDSEFRLLRPGDKVSVSGYGIAFDALVTGPHTSNGEVPIHGAAIHHRAENLDYVYQKHMAGFRTTEPESPVAATRVDRRVARGIDFC
ncbi:hypothetical protein [Candidatus Amarolinea dominans]|uniref:hypothetical protein n=1 Tax=Candidatus Amarolinea dominans TaxID=3140696 RepID=UPI0031362499|nr:hypothetical protein [Anaerolineae bacterium]